MSNSFLKRDSYIHGEYILKKLNIDVYEGDLEIREPTIIQSSSEKIVIKGTLECYDDCEIDKNLECHNLRAYESDITVNGNLYVISDIRVKKGSLYVKGSLESPKVAIDNILEVNKSSKIERLSVGNTFETQLGEIRILSIGNKIHAETLKSEKISVGNLVECDSIETDSISVGNKLECKQLKASKISVGGTLEVEKINAEKVSVGGIIKVDTAEISGKISVGGSLSVDNFIKSKKVEAGGTLNIKKGEIDNVDVGGVLYIDSELKSIKIDVGGSIKSSGKITAEDIDVGGSIRCNSDLIVTNSLDVGNSIDVNGVLKGGRIDIGNRVSAVKIMAKSLSTNTIETKDGVWARYVEVANRGRVKGIIVAEHVYLNEKTSAETIYGKYIEIDDRCRVENIYGYNIKIGEQAKVYGEVKYKEDIKIDKDTFLASEPVKVKKIDLLDSFLTSLP